jgi:hypothetical protein
MIDPGTSAGLANIAARERDVRNAYQPGFVPETNDVARAPRVVATQDPLSVAAPQGTYFLTKDAAGRIAFSRDGGFVLIDGELRASDGSSVLGFALGHRGALGPLQVDPYDRALGRMNGARIEADGSVSYERTTIDPRSGERRSDRIVAGKLALARFPAGTQPVRLDGVRVVPPAGVKARVGAPGEGDFAALVPHARDLGGIDVVAGLQKVKEAYESFDALRAAHHARGTVEKAAMDLVK